VQNKANLEASLSSDENNLRNFRGEETTFDYKRSENQRVFTHKKRKVREETSLENSKCPFHSQINEKRSQVCLVFVVFSFFGKPCSPEKKTTRKAFSVL
jgi:hypothetical protein